MNELDWEEDTAPCTRCENEVDPSTLTVYGSWNLCEICVGDI